ncbi:MAG: ABC transporter permease [Anaerolineae bacterium]|nr:ABC transporter permease [Anaerolineae bacterium]
MNGHLLEVFRYEFGRNIRRKGYLFGTFGIPILAIVLLFGIQIVSNLSNSGPDAAEVANAVDFEGIKQAGYVDETGLFGTIPDDLQEVMTQYTSEADAEAALEQGDIDVYYIIPSDYVETGDVQLVMPSMALNKINGGPVRQLILSTLSQGIDQPLYQRLLDPSNVTEVNVERDVPADVGPQNFDTRFILVYIFAIALMLGLFVTNGYLMQGVIEEKETRVVEILLSTVRPVSLLAGKILAFALMGIFQMLVWLGIFILVLRFASADLLSSISVLANIYLPLDVLPLVLVYFVLAYLFFATAYGIVGALSTSMQEGPQFAVIFTLPAVVPLYFISIFVETPDAPLSVALSLIPVTSPLAMTMRLLISSVPGWQIALSMGLLALTIVGMIWLAGRLFRVQTLLAGNTPRWRDLPRLLRG